MGKAPDVSCCWFGSSWKQPAEVQVQRWFLQRLGSAVWPMVSPTTERTWRWECGKLYCHQRLLLLFIAQGARYSCPGSTFFLFSSSQTLEQLGEKQNNIYTFVSRPLFISLRLSSLFFLPTPFPFSPFLLPCLFLPSFPSFFFFLLFVCNLYYTTISNTSVI